MKRLAELLVRLYPADWRARYGDELRTVLEDAAPTASALFDLAKGALVMRLRTVSISGVAVLFCATGAAIGLAAAFAFAPVYTATVRAQLRPALFSEGLHAPVPGWRGDRIIAETTERLETTNTLAAIMRHERLHLYSLRRSIFPIRRVADRMRSEMRVAVLPSPKPGVTNFEISFRYSDPVKAKEATFALLSRFIDLAYRDQQRNLRKPDSNTKLIELLEAPYVPQDRNVPEWFVYTGLGSVGGLIAAWALVRVDRRKHLSHLRTSHDLAVI